MVDVRRLEGSRRRALRVVPPRRVRRHLYDQLELVDVDDAVARDVKVSEEFAQQVELGGARWRARTLGQPTAPLATACTTACTTGPAAACTEEVDGGAAVAADEPRLEPRRTSVQLGVRAAAAPLLVGRRPPPLARKLVLPRRQPHLHLTVFLCEHAPLLRPERRGRRAVGDGGRLLELPARPAELLVPPQPLAVRRRRRAVLLVRLPVVFRCECALPQQHGRLGLRVLVLAGGALQVGHPDARHVGARGHLHRPADRAQRADAARCPRRHSELVPEQNARGGVVG